MLSRLREHLGTAGLIVAIVALVAALGGGAIAATGGSGDGNATASAKQGKQGKPGKTGKTGPAGPAGPAGPDGPAGPAGAKGDTGAAGANGSSGQSVTSEEFTGAKEGKCGAGNGGSKFTSAGGSTFACNGKPGEQGEPGEEGSPWTELGTLPPGETETGSWSFAGSYHESARPIAALSFEIPLADPLGPSQVHLINYGGLEMNLNLDSGEVEEVTPTKCGTALSPAGTSSDPAAAPGHLCVYAGPKLVKSEGFFSSSFITDPGEECQGFTCDPLVGGPGAGSSVAGALVTFEYDTAGFRKGWGTWAVTAPAGA